MLIINVNSSISYYGWVQIPDSGFTSDQNTLGLCSWKSLVESAKDPKISFATREVSFNVTSIFNQTEKLCLTRWSNGGLEYSPCLKTFKELFLPYGIHESCFSKCFIVSAAAPGHEHCCPAVPVQFWLHAWAHFHAGKQNLQLAGFSQTASGFPPGFLSCVQFSSSLTTVSAAGVFRMTSRVWLIPKGMFSLAAKKISLVPLDWETSLGNRQICAHPVPFTVSGVGTEHEFQDQQWPA